MCRVRGFNLSYQSLTSFEARERLRSLKSTDPDFYAELSAGRNLGEIKHDEVVQEDDPEIVGIGEVDDDSDLPCKAVIAIVTGQPPPMKLLTAADGSLASAAQAESLELETTSSSGEISAPEELGVGKRKRTANVLYKSDNFWHHRDEDSSDDEFLE